MRFVILMFQGVKFEGNCIVANVNADDIGIALDEYEAYSINTLVTISNAGGVKHDAWWY